EEGVELKNVSTYRQKYKINHNFFDEIDTEEKAYWLGFLYADGCVREDRGCFRLGLQARDVRHLEKFRESLDSNHTIKETNKVTNEKIYYGNYIFIHSKKLVKNLVEKGCFENKSLTLKFPSYDIVPKHLIYHFIRGYFDGDGSVSYTVRNGKH